ncbi:MAG: nickel pincer cofactor biosynthesis protein LarC [Acidobacteriota bacterium]|nr:nickel pincer cofactor biosynthesis protein LarC [Acidobacteriota bacterium]
MGKIVYLDCFSGASGDMFLGALLDVGLPIDNLRTALGSLALDKGGWSIEAERVDRAGIAATKFRLHETGNVESAKPSNSDSAHGHHHDSSHGRSHSHHSLKEINRLINSSAISDEAKGRAVRLFQRLAEVEASIHQMPVEEVHLHEVGALDSIIDIVGAVHGLEWLNAEMIVASPLNVGSGTVSCAHGEFPVPAPATAQLLENAPIYSSGVQGELVTPTGALLVTEFASSYGPLPDMCVKQIGYGAGERDQKGSPNVLRLMIGDSTADTSMQRVLVMECEIDDMNPELFGVLMDRLYDGGALDVFYVPVQMKKNRPGTLVTVIASPNRREILSDIIFRESTSIGLRFSEMTRECLDRSTTTVETQVGSVRVKVAQRGGRIINVAPEFEDCVRLATDCDIPVKEVQALAHKAYLERASSD